MQVKGTVLSSRMAFIRSRGGEEAVGRVLGRLSPQDRETLSGPLWAMAWFPLELNLALDAAIAAEWGQGDGRDIFREMGRRSADENLLGPQKAYLRKGEPQRFLAASPDIYKFYYDKGYRTYEKQGERGAVLKTFDAEVPNPRDCLTNLGWHERALELCGAQGVSVTDPKCRARGDAICEYVCRWEKP